MFYFPPDRHTPSRPSVLLPRKHPASLLTSQTVSSWKTPSEKPESGFWKQRSFRLVHSWYFCHGLMWFDLKHWHNSFSGQWLHIVGGQSVWHGSTRTSHSGPPGAFRQVGVFNGWSARMERIYSCNVPSERLDPQPAGGKNPQNQFKWILNP